jgi:nanoRNase/pAp phosphatase (c-di-AMP/oligoRNAs hydrolase)
MQSRLVVGCGQIGHALVEELRDRPGELLVLDEDERRVERLRDDGVAATQLPALTPEGLRAATDDPETVIVAADDSEANRRRVEVVREVFPEAFLLAYTGVEPDQTVVSELRTLADRVVDLGSATNAFLLDKIGDEGLQYRQLRQVFWEVTEPLAIVTHDNPDPDAIASALALERLADAFDVEATVCYYGQITHQENRAFINLLDIDLRRLDGDDAIEEFGSFALVDHSRPGVNDQLPEDTTVHIVIDHHPPRTPVDARFVDLRSEVGATSTLLVQYLRQFGIPFEETVATALLFGIRIDTDDFSREVSTDDFEAAAYLLPKANVATLERIESSSVSGETFGTIARAISNRKRRGSILTSNVGKPLERDALAQAADRLLDLEGINATVIYGVMDGVVYVSGRARGTDLDIGETLREAFDQIGSAGGHADMAGGQIPLAETTLETGSAGIEGDETEGDGEADVADIPPDIETFINERFFEAVESRPPREIAQLYTSIELLRSDTDW